MATTGYSAPAERLLALEATWGKGDTKKPYKGTMN
jgi:hypothetical protein